MGDKPPVEAEYLSESTLDENGPRNNQYTGAFFPGAQNFVIAGGKFKSITNITAPTVPSDFRIIPMGDLDLREEIRPRHRSGVVYRGEGKATVRRVYSARIHGSKSKMTVAVYQGENAEKEWREDISRYSWLLHPNILQLYATASRSGIHAAVFHDELIPATQILEKYRGSHLSTVHLNHYLNAEFDDVEQYMVSIVGRCSKSWHYMMWIRCSTGRLCVDLTPPEADLLWVCFGVSSSSAPSSAEPPDDSQIIESTPLDVYHEICCISLAHDRYIPISPDVSVQPGAIISCATGTGIEHSTVIAGIPGNVFDDFGWSGTSEEVLITLVMEDGWTRISSSELEDGTSINHTIWSNYYARVGWPAQANHIFDRLGITSNYDDYVHVNHIQYQLTLTNTGSIPPGYLFLCPRRAFESEIPSHFRFPECPAHWSLDPMGAERLSPEEADKLGFSRLELKMEVGIHSWDERVYTGIHQFHNTKGYDPYSQDVARELGYPLFRISSELESFEETETCSGDEDSEEDDRLRSNEVDGDSGEDSSLVKRIQPLLDEAEPLEPSRTWKIVMDVQFILILTSTVFCLISYFPLIPTSLNT